MPGLKENAVGALRRVGAHPRLEPGVALLLRARTVRGSGRFLARELLRRDLVADYPIRGGGLRVLVRHHTPDVVTLGEVFHQRDYAPPPAVEALLGPSPRVVDLGANVGMFGVDLFARRPGATLTAFEPDPANAAVLRRTVAANVLGGRWEVVEAAAGAAEGRVRFSADRFALGAVGEGDLEVRSVDVLPLLAEADLLKMDIEGGEWPILDDPRFGAEGPRIVVLEYHPYLCPSPEPRAHVEGRLRDLGYELAAIHHRDDGYGMLWAWR